MSSATIINNIIEGNEPSGIWHRGFQTALIEANLFINNKVRGFDSNISVDPEFVDPEIGNFRLSSTSPCIDGGEPTITR